MGKRRKQSRRAGMERRWAGRSGEVVTRQVGEEKTPPPPPSEKQIGKQARTSRFRYTDR